MDNREIWPNRHRLGISERDKLVYFHEGGKHVGPYFGVRSGLYNFKVVGPGYKPLPGDRALIIPFRIPKPTGTLK